jgi:hypothetical protein
VGTNPEVQLRAFRFLGAGAQALGHVALLFIGKLPLGAKRVLAHAEGPRWAVNRGALTNLARVAAATVEAARPKGLQGILLPMVAGEDFGRHVPGVSAYQFAAVASERGYFEEVLPAADDLCLNLGTGDALAGLGIRVASGAASAYKLSVQPSLISSS